MWLHLSRYERPPVRQYGDARASTEPRRLTADSSFATRLRAKRGERGLESSRSGAVPARRRPWGPVGLPDGARRGDGVPSLELYSATIPSRNAAPRRTARPSNGPVPRVQRRTKIDQVRLALRMSLVSIAAHLHRPFSGSVATLAGGASAGPPASPLLQGLFLQSPVRAQDVGGEILTLTAASRQPCGAPASACVLRHRPSGRRASTAACRTCARNARRARP